MPTKTFIKAGTNENPKVTAGEVYDPSNSAMKLHQLAKHNNVIEIYEKVREIFAWDLHFDYTTNLLSYGRSYW